jgi:hypothetical protein
VKRIVAKTRQKPNKKTLETLSLPMIKTRMPDYDDKIKFKGMPLGDMEKMMEKQKINVATASKATIKNYSGVTINKSITFLEGFQAPYTDADLQLFEASVRRNWAVKSGLTVREHFTFGYGSELVIELAESETVGLTQEEIQKKIDQLTKKHQDIIKKAYDRDEQVKLMPNLKIATWQAWIFGRGATVKLFKGSETATSKVIGNTKQTGSEEVIGLKTINTRRLGIPILNTDNNMSFEGVVVDGQGLDKDSMIYLNYMPYQFSPYTEGYGYSNLETVVSIAESLNIAVEEDYKEILKSAWLASIMFVINTAGLSEEQAKSKIGTIIDSIAPAKYIGINEDIQDFKQLDLDPDFGGLVQLTDNLETKIYKALQVPQFLVQSESIANRATALQSASLFINGVIQSDQTWLSDSLSDQWYDPFVTKELKKKEKIIIGQKNKRIGEQALIRDDLLLQQNDETKLVDEKAGDASGINESAEPKFRIRRTFNQARVADFLDLADAITKLHATGIWDLQKVNEELGSEEVIPRVEKEAKDAKVEADKQAKENPMMKPEPTAKDEIVKKAKSITEDVSTANVDPNDLDKYKTIVMMQLAKKLSKQT